MRFGILVLTILLVQVPLLGPAPRAAEDGVEAVEERYAASVQRQDYQAALAQARKYEALIKAQYGKQDGHYAAALRKLAETYESLGALDTSERYFGQAISLYESLGGSDPDALVQTLESLGGLYRYHMQHYSKAEATFKSVIAVREKSCEDPSMGICTNLIDATYALAEFYQDVHRDHDAEDILRSVIKYYEQRASPAPKFPAIGASDPGYSGLIDAIRHLAKLFDRKLQYPRAEAFYARILALHEQAAAGLPEEPVARYILPALLDLGNNYKHQNRPDDAAKIYLRAMTLAERCIRSPCEEVYPGDLRSNFLALADLREAQGHYKEEEDVLRRLLEIEEQRAAADDLLETERTVNRLIEFYRVFGRDDEARKTQGRLLALYLRLSDGLQRELKGADAASYQGWVVAYSLETVTGMIATVYRAQQNYREARLFYDRLVQMRQKRLRPDEQGELWKPLMDLAFVEDRLGQTAAAANSRKRAVQTFEEYIGGSIAKDTAVS
jgi:tetratricopeptide (TPR) repeat protein